MTTETKAVLGESVLDVTMADGAASRVKLRALKIRELYQFAEYVAGGQGPELVALATGQPAEWVDALSPESFAKLLGEARALNFPKVTPILGAEITLGAKVWQAIRAMESAASAISPAPSASPDSAGPTSSS